MDWITILIFLAVFVLICPVGMHLMMRHRKRAATPATSVAHPDARSDEVPGAKISSDRGDALHELRNVRSSESPRREDG